MKKIIVTVTLPAGAWAEIEEMAKRMDWELKDPEFLPDEKPIKPVRHSRTKVTKADVRSVAAAMETNPGLAALDIKDALDLPYSKSTMYRIMGGEYNDMLEA
jgi:hypothetical protein